MESVALLAVLLWFLRPAQAETFLIVRKGSDVRLDVTRADVPGKFIALLWKFNHGKKPLVTFEPGKEPAVDPAYSGKVEVSVQNYSVTLKNLQESDSGVYSAQVLTRGPSTVAEYRIMVQAPVSPVELTVDSVTNSSDSCNLTVTCRTRDPDLSSTFTCVSQSCREDGEVRSKITTSGADLRLYVEKGSIKCNHSNQISWATNEKQRKIQDFCPFLPEAVTPVIVRKGSDVRLDLTRADVPEVFLALLWQFNHGKKHLVTFRPGKEPAVDPAYSGRVEVFVQNYSVTLKNLQESDSGVYSAEVMTPEEQTVAEYSVTVQAPVSPAELTVDSVSSSSDSCNLTVTCRTRDSNLSSTFTCVSQNCREDGEVRSKITTSGADHRLYIEKGSITCNHSNQISWATNKEQRKIQDFCLLQTKAEEDITVIVLRAVVPSGTLVILILIGIICIRKKIKKNNQIMDSPVYDVPEDLAQTPDQDAQNLIYMLLKLPSTGEDYTDTKNFQEKFIPVYAQRTQTAEVETLVSCEE